MGPAWPSGSSTSLGFTGIWLVLAVLPGRAGLFPASFRPGRDPVRARCGRLGGARRPAGCAGRALADGDGADHHRGRAGGHGAGAAPGDRRPGGLGGGGAAAAGRAGRRPGHLPQCHPDPGGGAGAHGRRGRWRAPDRHAGRLGGRHRPAGLGVLPDPDRQRPCRPQGGVRCPAVRLRADAGGPATGHGRALAAAHRPAGPPGVRPRTQHHQLRLG